MKTFWFLLIVLFTTFGCTSYEGIIIQKFSGVVISMDENCEIRSIVPRYKSYTNVVYSNCVTVKIDTSVMQVPVGLFDNLSVGDEVIVQRKITPYRVTNKIAWW